MAGRRVIKVNDLRAHLGLPPILPSDLAGHEDNPGEKVLTPILRRLGYDDVTDIKRKPSLSHNILLGKAVSPDFGILRYVETPRDQFGMVADSKALGENLARWEEKLAGYCGLAGAVRGILTNGQEILVIEPTRGVVEWVWHDSIPAKVELEELVLRQPKQYDEPSIVYAGRITEEVSGTTIERLAQYCHEVIRSREGMAIPERLYEFSKLLLTRMVDERRYAEGRQAELFLTRGRLESLMSRGVSIGDYINDRFELVREEIGIFASAERIALREDVMLDIIGRLDAYPLWLAHVDVLGQVYEKFLMNTMTGRELGEYFTPRSVVETLVAMVDPSQNHSILDPACGTGGFLIYAFDYLVRKHSAEDQASRRRLASNLFGIDQVLDIVRLSKINLWLHGDSHDNVVRADSLDPVQAPPFLKNALVNPEESGFDLVLTNPPFGAKGGNRLPRETVQRLSDAWHELGVDLFQCGFTGGAPRSLQAQSPFVELCIKALRKPRRRGEGGRLGTVIDNGILSGVAGEAPSVRTLIQDETIIEAIVGLPKGTFQPYGSNVIPSFLILRRKYPGEEQQGIFRAEVTKVGLVPRYQRYKADSDEDLRRTVEYWSSWRNRG